MSFKTTVAATAAALVIALPAFAGSEITVTDAYARSSGMSAKAGAAFMTILNSSGEDDRLVTVHTGAAKLAQLHTNIEGEGGVMQMRRVESGFAIPARGKHVLARGGDHIMLMGLIRPLIDGESLTLTLIFEKAGEITITVPVDLKR